MPEPGPATILVVDDNPASLYSTIRMLRSANFSVVEAATGEQGVAATSSGGVDLVILDVNLPDIDGFEVCRRIRAHPPTARTPVIHLSATFVQDEYKVHGLDVGADGYLTHPVEPPVLIATVNAFLRARRAEEAMRKSEAKFKAVFENALNGIALIDQGHRFLDVNPAMCRLLGGRCGDIVGRRVADFIPPDRREDNAAIDRQLEASGDWRGYLPMVRSDGALMHLDWSLSIHSLPGVRLAVVTDITERIASEKERERLLDSERAARAEAERANRLKDDFLATVSHELRTPLSAVLLWARLLNSGTLSDEDHDEAVRAIIHGTDAQKELIDDLLDASRISSGHLELDVRETDPRGPVRAAVELVRPMAEAKRVSLKLADGGDAGSVRADAERLQQVVMNLLTNALKFTPQGGRVDVRLERVRGGSGATSGGVAAGDVARLTIRDTGKGISAAFLPHVFERFRQAEGSINRRHAGLGLGLAIVHELVTLHGGSIRADSGGEGKGATFTVDLPVVDPSGDRGDAADGSGDARPRPASSPVPTSSRRPPGVVLAGVRVLLVEDDPGTRRALRLILQGSGAEVDEADTAAAALDALGGGTPDLMVSDIGLPGEDGYSLMARARALLVGRQMTVPPALAITAFAQAQDRERALAAGFQAYLAKPVDPGDFIRVVGELVGTGP
jgi:PAS domain S-box-containing protein